jgi:hypothetical protein
MLVAGLSQGRTEASTFVVEAPLERKKSSRQCQNPRPRPSSAARGKTARRQWAADLRGGCQRAAEYIRNSTGTAHDEQGREVAVEDRPWPRLLLWVVACAALVVSLVIRTDGLDERDPGSAVRVMATEEVSETGRPLLSSMLPRGETDTLVIKSGPRG